MAETPSRGAYGSGEFLLLAFGFAALVAVGLASAWLVSRNADEARLAARTLETKAAIVEVLGVARDAETGQRGYLLTGDERYLTSYNPAVASIEDHRRKLRALIDPASPQRQPLEQLLAQLRAKFEELSETIALKREGRDVDALAVMETERGRNAMLAIRGLVKSMTAEEDKLFAERAAAAIASSRWLLALVALGLVVAAALAIAAQFIVRKQMRLLAEAEAVALQAKEGLESAVRERTEELVSANEEIQRFAYIVSHDLRAPLVNVMGFTSELDAARRVLKDQIDRLDEEEAKRVTQEARLAVEEDLPEAIEFIRTSTAKMDRLINAILRLSREGRREIKPEQVSVEELVKGIAATIYQQTQAADAEIAVSPGLPSLVTDRLSVEQIFQNLIENAVKYLDRSRPGRVVIGGRRLGALVEYTVADNGRGIDAKDHERVFELFRRAGSQDQPGEGLGLTFVRASVRRLGGVISLSSEPGAGTTFQLTFPAVLRPQTESRAA